MLSDTDPESRSGWSGIPFYVNKALKSKYSDVRHIEARHLNSITTIISRASLYRVDAVREPLLASHFSRSIVKVLEKMDPDLIFATSCSHIISQLPPKWPVIHFADATFHGMLDYYPGKFSRINGRSRMLGESMETEALHRADLVLFPSEWAARSAIEHYLVPSEKVFVVPFGANLDDDPGDNLKYNRSNTCRLLFCGKEWDRKGGGIAVEALSLLNRMGVKAEVHILGCVPPSGVDLANIVVHGFLNKSNPDQAEKINQLFSTSDFLFLPTKAEAYGIVFAEAAAFGLPSITSRTGGIPSAVEHGQTGLLIDRPESAEDFANGIVDLWRNEERYYLMRRNSRSAYLDRLRWPEWVRQIDDILMSTGFLG